MSTRIINADVLAGLAQLDPESCHACVTDPPYHLTQLSRRGSHRSNDPQTPYGRHRIGDKGFMGKTWDGGDIAFRSETWAAVLRVLKPGAHMLAFGGTRTFHRLMCAIEDAGFELVDTIGWLHGEGFPKSKNLHVCSLDRVDWSGFGTQLKPAWEPIILARKPLPATVTDNVLEHGCGALNIDACRVPVDVGDEKGRWPANLVHDGSDDVVRLFPSNTGAFAQATRRNADKFRGVYGAFAGTEENGRQPDGLGSAARFFYCAKASRADRNEGLQDRERKAVNWSSGDQSPGTFQSPNTDRRQENHHPTVKPTELMRWLIRLVCPYGSLVVDPFMGSGSTGKAAAIEQVDFIGIDHDAEYCEMASARIDADAPLFA